MSCRLYWIWRNQLVKSISLHSSGLYRLHLVIIQHFWSCVVSFSSSIQFNFLISTFMMISKQLQNGLNSLINWINCSILFFIHILHITLIYHSYLKVLFNTHKFLIIVISFTFQITYLLNHALWSNTINICFWMIPSFSWRECFKSSISFS